MKTPPRIWGTLAQAGMARRARMISPPWRSMTLQRSPPFRESDVQAPEDDQDELRRLHEAALRRFLLDEPELGSDDEPLAGARTRMLNDHGIDVGISVFNPATGEVTCKLCSIVLNSKSQWTDHQKGNKHFKKLSAEERRTGTNAQKLDNTNVPAGSYQ